MSRFVLALGITLVAMMVSLPTWAGDKKKETEPVFPPVKLGPEHKILETLVGVYDAKVKMYLDPTKPATESTGVMTRKMILGGNYLQESYTGSFFGKTFTGMGVVGFDAQKKKFVTTWVDSMSTSISMMQGTYNADKMTLTNHGEEISPDGKKIKMRDVLRIVNANEQVFEMFREPEGAPSEFKVMEITYKRKTGAK